MIKPENIQSQPAANSEPHYQKGAGWGMMLRNEVTTFSTANNLNVFVGLKLDSLLF